MKTFKNIKFVDEVSNKLPNDLSGTNVYNTLEFCWYSLLTILQRTSVTSVNSR